jgi:hypothetical protein
MPYEDRGSWVQVIDFTGSSGEQQVDRPEAPRPPPLAATGARPLVAVMGLVLLVLAWRLRRHFH